MLNICFKHFWFLQDICLDLVETRDHLYTSDAQSATIHYIDFHLKNMQYNCTLHIKKTISERQVTNQKQDDYCLNESETRRFTLNWIIHYVF